MDDYGGHGAESEKNVDIESRRLHKNNSQNEEAFRYLEKRLGLTAKTSIVTISEITSQMSKKWKKYNLT